MEEHDRAGQHPQQGEGPHADRTAEEFVERGGHAADIDGVPSPAPLTLRARVHGSGDPNLGWIGVVPGGHRGLQVPGLMVARVLPATQSSADSRNASWLSSPALAWWRIEG